MIECRGLSVGYRTGRRPVPILRDVDAGVAPGEVVALVGANGAGKSTLLRTLAELQPALAGQVLLDGGDAGRLGRLARARTLATVLTDPVRVDHLRVDELVATGRHPHTGWTHTLGVADRAAIAAGLATAGVAHLADRLVASLSDGQRQRVLLARALAQQPRMLLLDEPTSFLDPPGRVGIIALLRRVADAGTAVLVSTHEVELALRHCDRLWVAHGGQVRCGTPDELVAGGAVAAAFNTSDVAFCPERRAFHEVVA